MTITDDSTATPTPPPAAPSYVRRHPILAAFGVLSGLSLFSALWPVSAVVVAVAVASHATGLDRTALRLTERLAARITASVRHREHTAPAPVPPAPAVPEPSAPAPSTPRHEAHAPVVPAARSRRAPHAHAPTAHRGTPARRPRTAERHVGSGIDGPDV